MYKAVHLRGLMFNKIQIASMRSSLFWNVRQRTFQLTHLLGQPRGLKFKRQALDW